MEESDLPVHLLLDPDGIIGSKDSLEGDCVPGPLQNRLTSIFFSVFSNRKINHSSTLERVFGNFKR